jgi:hypothetical protein
MGDPRGPEKGWSKILPVRRGWYEVAEEKQIEEERSELMPIATRFWFDGSGGMYAPIQIPRFQAKQFNLKPSQILKVGPMHLTIMVPIQGGDFSNTYFRAIGPLLDPSLPENPEPFVPRFQRPETYMTPSQRREAAEIESRRPKRPQDEKSP